MNQELRISLPNWSHFLPKDPYQENPLDMADALI